MGIIKDSNLYLLKKDYPIDIKDLIEDCDKFEFRCKINRKDINKTKENLQDAKGILQLIMSNLMSRLHTLDLLKSDEERDIWVKLNADINRCLGVLDVIEKDLITGRDEDEIGLSHLSSFKTVLQTSYFCIIINSLERAKKEYVERIRDSDVIKDKDKAFFFVLYEVMSISCSTLYGVERLNIRGIKNTGMGSASSSSWPDLYKKSLLKEIKKLTGKNKGELKDKDKENLLSEINKLEQTYPSSEEESFGEDEEDHTED